MPFVLAQRWISDTESDLGLGTVVAVDGRTVTMLFSATGENRLFARHDAPLTRVVFNVGDTVESHEEWSMLITAVEESEGLLTYVGTRTDSGEANVRLREVMLSHHIRFNKPQDRLFAGQIDRMNHFTLRYHCLQHHHQLQSSPLLGLSGARTSLIPHQLHIAREVGNRFAPRVLLADEVGLGKTIEAGMIIHQQLLTGRAERILILVPETLQNQWLVEMLRRFNLRFSVFDEERCVEAYADADNPFDTEQLIIASLGLMRKKNRLDQALDADWDLLIVDEAHHLEWHADKPSREYRIVEQLANTTPGVLLLTATPDQLGHESHFARLRLLDPDRFYDYQAFLNEEKEYQQVADAAKQLTEQHQLSEATQALLTALLPERNIQPLLRDIAEDDCAQAREQLLQCLLDRHGTSRVLMRNTRQAVKGFPQRILHRHALPMPQQYKTAIKVSQMMDNDAKDLAIAAREYLYPEEIFQKFEGKDASWWGFDPRVEWLISLLKESREKVLVICAHAHTALLLEEAMRTKEGIRSAVFHEGLSIIARDKAAAYFAQREEGAQVLVCSEIGSEGRNFQFARHMVLFDLPLNPDLLEQRIGRLDRIGQQHDIQIHVPYLQGSSQELLLAWYHNGLNAFEQTCPTGGEVFEKFNASLYRLLCVSDSPQSELDELIEQSRAFNQQLKTQLEQGRDRLLEINSGGQRIGKAIAEQIAQQDDQPSLATFMLSMLDICGVEQEDHGDNALILRPAGHMLMPHFPCLPEEGTTITFDRHTALAREDFQFVSWEHPMVQGSIDMILSGDTGNNALSILKSKALPAGTTLLELIYVADTSAPKEYRIGRFLPATPIRLLLDKNGQNLGASVSFDSLNGQLSPVGRHIASKIANASQALVHQLIQQGDTMAAEQLDSLKTGAQAAMAQQLDQELERLQDLKVVNPNIRDEELEHLQEQKQQLAAYIDKAQFQLDSLRLVVVSPE